jgi:hypothetical protein
LLKLIRRQVAKLLLDRPELVEQGASVPLRPDWDGRFAEILSSKIRSGNVDLGTPE